jgi:tetratricopeptide (TPR) repeat protein/V8-like Glu-specific endopeptidase
MKYSLVLLGCSVALVAFVQPVSAKSAADIERVARSVSVEMISGVGSGVLVHRQGDLYTVITNRHVVCKEKKLCDESGVRSSYQLKTNDGQKYQVGRSAIKLLKDAGGNKLDLAIVQFRSSRNYAVAQVAEPGSLKVDDAVYTAGFPRGQSWLFGQGEAQAVVNKRLVGDKGGYTVVYNADTLPGMSGGGAFNSEGRLVAIHGQGDRYTDNTEAGSSYVRDEVGSKIGYNRGIPIRWVVQGLSERGIVVGNRSLPGVVQAGAVAAATADEFFVAGFNKVLEPGADVRRGREEAVRELSRAIAINPKYTIAYFMRGIVNELLGNYSSALADFNRVIVLNPKLAAPHVNRGILKKDKFNDSQGALADFNQAIALSPGDTLAYNNRGTVKDDLNDLQGALADYNQAIALNPKNASAYNNRGALKAQKLNDPQGALTDYNRSIALNPQSTQTYNNRGVLKKNQLKDPQGALADFNQAIALNPKYTSAYYNRGNLKVDQLNDYQGALADYNQAIALNPKLTEAHLNRGLLKFNKLSDRPGGIQDLRTAARLYRAQGNTAKAQQILDALRQLGVSE